MMWPSQPDLCSCATVVSMASILDADAALAKLHFRWRTALIVRELEEEVLALEKGRQHREQLRVLRRSPSMHAHDILQYSSRLQSFFFESRYGLT